MRVYIQYIYISITYINILYMYIYIYYTCRYIYIYIYIYIYYIYDKMYVHGGHILQEEILEFFEEINLVTIWMAINTNKIRREIRNVNIYRLTSGIVMADQQVNL